MRFLEPFCEYLSDTVDLDEKDWAAGPALLSVNKLAVGRQLKWELGFLFGLHHQTPEYNLRASLEFEF